MEVAMTIHEEIRRHQADWSHGPGLHADADADAAEMAIYETARTLGYLTTQAARIATQYGRSLNL